MQMRCRRGRHGLGDTSVLLDRTLSGVKSHDELTTFS